MVSKSKILGQSSLIFVTVGSTNFQQDRIFSAIDKSLIDLNKNSNLIVQQGSSNYKWRYKNISSQKYLRPGEILALIKKADKIITHAGPISIYNTANYARCMPLIIPRLVEFQEHVDNHQLYFAKFMQNQLPARLHKFFLIDNEVKSQIKNYLDQKPQKNILNKYLFLSSSSDVLNKNLENYLLSHKL